MNIEHYVLSFLEYLCKKTNYFYLAPFKYSAYFKNGF